MKSTSTKSQKPESERRERQDWLIVLLILLLGFMCVICAGQSALRFVPNWKLDANMQSGIEPNSNVQPAGFIEPIDPGILTQPAWVKVFLTPGAKFVTGTPPPVGMPVNKTPTAQATSLVPVTNTVPVITLTNTVVPTNTFIWLPGTTVPGNTHVPHNTSVPPVNTPVNTSPPSPGTTADLAINTDDGTLIYTPGGTLTYTITVTNNGPDSVTGATVVDSFPFVPGGQITSTSWTCIGVACPVPNGAGNINVTLGTLSSGLSIVFSVTANIDPGASGNLSNTATVTAPAGVTDAGGNNAEGDTDTVVARADLAVTINDTLPGYGPGSTLNYTITITNNGPDPVTNASVTNVFDNPGVISNISWICPGANCPAPGGAGGSLTNTLFNLPSTQSVVFTVTAQIWPTLLIPSGSLTNTATVSVPPTHIDLGPGPNTDADIDIAQVSVGRDCGLAETDCLYEIPEGTSITLMLGTPIDVGGGPEPAWDLIYYERWHPEVYIDQVQIEIGDGTNWYTVFYWGDGIVDPNTILTVRNILPEDDKRTPPIPTGWLYGGNSGLAIDVDGAPGIAPGSYQYVRITAPVGGGTCPMDGIALP